MKPRRSNFYKIFKKYLFSVITKFPAISLISLLLVICTVVYLNSLLSKCGASETEVSAQIGLLNGIRFDVKAKYPSPGNSACFKS
jgi:hypothetical protein